ncbi:hypothetical protein NQZ68_040442, partial [Dissostichus eleginoides]
MSARLCAGSLIKKDCCFASTSVLHPRLLYYECLACLTECCLDGWSALTALLRAKGVVLVSPVAASPLFVCRAVLPLILVFLC